MKDQLKILEISISNYKFSQLLKESAIDIFYNAEQIVDIQDGELLNVNKIEPQYPVNLSKKEIYQIKHIDKDIVIIEGRTVS